MRKGAFLDRDGVLNRERGQHTWSLPEFEVLPGVPQALRLLQDAGWVLVVITNQSGIGLGLYGHAEVEEVHGYLRRALADQGVQLSDVFYCPHHPSKGKCLCRKPGSLLLERAMAIHGIDAARSVMIGDRDRDVDAAAACGVRGIRVDSNEALLPVVGEHVLNA
ncbi:MAG: HAD family hydrolase [Flavobacteriales bacterium]|nr:HAD family hydrolase [Flavobacteriales bacterium]